MSSSGQWCSVGNCPQLNTRYCCYRTGTKTIFLLIIKYNSLVRVPALAPSVLPILYSAGAIPLLLRTSTIIFYSTPYADTYVRCTVHRTVLRRIVQAQCCIIVIGDRPAGPAVTGTVNLNLDLA